MGLTVVGCVEYVDVKSRGALMWGCMAVSGG